MTAPLFTPDRAFISPETYDAFFAVVERLEATLDEETAALKGGRHDRLTQLTRQKRQGLLELDRLMKALKNAIPSQDIIARLAAFRGKVEANDAALRVALAAAQEVNAIIVRVMRDMESDGTYSRAYGRADYDFA